MSEELKMPERLPTDGEAGVTRDTADGVEYINIDVVTQGERYHLRMSEHNAWRVLGMLAFMVKVPLSKAAQKAIKF